MSQTLIVSISGLILGAIVQFGIKTYFRSKKIRMAKNEANDLLQMAHDEADSVKQEAETQAREYEENYQEKFVKEIQNKEAHVRKLEKNLEEQKEKYQTKMQSLEEVFNKEKSLVDAYDRQVNFKNKKYKTRKEIQQALFDDLVNKLQTKSEVTKDDVKLELSKMIENKALEKANKLSQLIEEETNIKLEKSAKRVISNVISRFARPYCAERGIGYLVFPNNDVKNRMLGPDNAHVLTMEKLCGVDLIYKEEVNSLSVSGFDPVRRELARASLERLMREKRIDENKIRSVVERTKKELFRKIRNDGQRISKEMKLEDLHPEVKNMMGGLRYRYSFAQNQYFHCGEVGFLCGLLSAELGLEIRDGRRAGLLHDIGKAMDHSLEGGHAVIGADFIEKHEEKPHIVHAVRAHHYDEQPDSDLAYMVIAADAISGARPGARRSTVTSYTQKMDQLEVIGQSFDNVLNTYVLSAGREVRVIVDSDKIDDMNALNLSRDIATKIEQECAYPGQIKVTVVRQTQAIEYAK